MLPDRAPPTLLGSCAASSCTTDTRQRCCRHSHRHRGERQDAPQWLGTSLLDAKTSDAAPQTRPRCRATCLHHSRSSGRSVGRTRRAEDEQQRTDPCEALGKEGRFPVCQCGYPGVPTSQCAVWAKHRRLRPADRTEIAQVVKQRKQRGGRLSWRLCMLDYYWTCSSPTGVLGSSGNSFSSPFSSNLV